MNQKVLRDWLGRKNHHIFVVAGSYQQFRMWATNHDVDPRGKRRGGWVPHDCTVEYLDNREKAHGIDGPTVLLVYTGTYWDNPFYNDREGRHFLESIVPEGNILHEAIG